MNKKEEKKNTNLKVEMLSTDLLAPSECNPYKVLDDEAMAELVESIREYGMHSPIAVRKKEYGDKYEVLSGHRRLFAAQKLGLEKVPVIKMDISIDEALMMLIDSNLHRPNILPSEKAHAYKLKMEVLAHQGKSCQDGTKLRSDEEIAKNSNDSARQVQRFIRLNELYPTLLDMVDEGKIGLVPAVEISYLEIVQQYELLKVIEQEDCTPSLAQVKQMRKLAQTGELNIDTIAEIMITPKPNQIEKLKIPADSIRKFFPTEYSDKQIEEAIIKLCEDNFKKMMRKRNSQVR